MAYATNDDVLARAGRIGAAFQVDGKRPSLDDIDGFLDDLTADVDDAIKGHGFDPSQLDAQSQKVLLDLVAYGALARAVRGLNDASPQVKQVQVEADAVWTSAMGDPASRQPDAIMGSMRRGDHPVIRALQSGEAGGVPIEAGSFWEDEPDYGRPYERLNEYWQLRGTNLAPGFSRGQHF